VDEVRSVLEPTEAQPNGFSNVVDSLSKLSKAKEAAAQVRSRGQLAGRGSAVGGCEAVSLCAAVGSE
jgi:hypothetical protein